MARTGIERASVKTLLPDKKNPNRGTERGATVIEQSLDRLGAGRSIVVDKNNKIIAGNQTAKAFQKLGKDDVQIIDSDGSKLVVVRRTDLDLDSGGIARELSLADNRTQELSYDVDPAIFAGLDESLDLSWMYTDDELAAILAQNKITDLLTDEDEVPEPPKVAKSKRGEIYLLGDHRLMCGDSTSADDVAKLMDGQLADMVWTDPPYGVSYVGKTKDALTIQNDGSLGLKALLDAAFAQASTILRAGAAIYIAHPPGALSVTFGVAFLAAGWRLHQTLVWDKCTIVLGHSDYHYSHEPIYYGYAPGTGRFGRGGKGWYGDNSQKSILVYPKPSRSEEHPTMKPVALVEHCVGNSSGHGQNVLDLFGGSGTTLIACEKLARCCYAMELDPIFTDVIIARWENATGQKAVLDGTKDSGKPKTTSKQREKQEKQAGRSPRPKHNDTSARARAS